MSSALTREMVLAALSKVQDPELHRDLVSLNMIRDLVVEDGKVSLSVMLTTPACPLKAQIEREVKEAIAKLPGVKQMQVKMGADVRHAPQPQAQVQLPIKHIIAISSGKGGVGKSTVAVNLAVTLAKSGAEVGLLDADIYGPNVPTMLGIEVAPGQDGDKITPAEAHGVKMISIAFFVKPGQPLIWRGPMLHSAIRQFLTDVTWGKLDYLIIDLPPGTGDVQLSLAQTIPLTGGVVVTMPQAVSTDDARRGLEMFRTMNIPILGVVENMSYLELPDGQKMDIFGTGGGERLAQESETVFLGAIPIDPDVRKGGDAGLPIVISAPDTAAARSLKSIAEKVAARASVISLEQKKDA